MKETVKGFKGRVGEGGGRERGVKKKEKQKCKVLSILRQGGGAARGGLLILIVF